MQTRQRPLHQDRTHSTHAHSVSPAKISSSQGEAAFQRWLNPPTDFSSALGEAIAWMAAAMAIRLVMDWLLASSTTFWTPVLVGLVAPAAIAVTLSTLMPQLSLVLGYRLILIMFGLLIGGKL